MGTKLALVLGILGSLLLPVALSSRYSSPETFDFVIAGGGTAGCAVASRLSENGKYTVLIIHDGGDAHPNLVIPGLVSPFNREPMNSKLYQVKAHSNPNLNTTVGFLVGKALGGSSTINGQFMNRGSPGDFNNWAKITGDNSWSYSNMLKYFKMSETYGGDFPSDQHGYQGPIPVTRPRYAPILPHWLEAGKSLGYPVADPNGPQKVSFAPIEFSRRFGRRVNSYAGYIEPNLARKNLKIIRFAEAKRIVFDGNKAVGVIYSLNGTSQQRFVRARKEIIVSAGVIGSPTLLMKSGIGPKPVLTRAKIFPVKYLPVGQNLHDHAMVNIDFVVNNKSAVHDPVRDLTPENFRIYNETGDGPYSTTNTTGGHAQSFIVSTQARLKNEQSWPDLHFFNGNPSPPLKSDGFTEDFQAAEWESPTSVFVIVSRPQSRGSITLNPMNADGQPKIDFRYMSNSQDMDVMLDGIKFALKIFEETPAFRKLGGYYPPIPLGACQHFQFRSNDYWRCFVEQKLTTGLHAGGSCRMGRRTDSNSVVDSELRVIGVDRLRVVDASIMPQMTNANPMAAVYGIAEKASDVILQNWETGKLRII